MIRQADRGGDVGRLGLDIRGSKAAIGLRWMRVQFCGDEDLGEGGEEVGRVRIVEDSATSGESLSSIPEAPAETDDLQEDLADPDGYSVLTTP